MNSLKVKDLREMAKSKGLKGWYRLRKSDLISFIKDFENQRRQERLEKPTAEANTKAEQKAISKGRRQAKREEAKREAE